MRKHPNAPASDRGFHCSSASRKFLNIRSSRTPQRQRGCFSALQRAENSSIAVPQRVLTRFQSFSALQRAENSSIRTSERCARLRQQFQCSSASRKFLNGICGARQSVARRRFSALQRAENSSIDESPLPRRERSH